MQSLEQQFDYLFKCAGVKLISCWDLKEHHIIPHHNHYHKNQKGKISIEFPLSSNSEKIVLYLFGIINKMSLTVSHQWR